MTLLKKRWRDTKDDGYKTAHHTSESEKVIIICWESHTTNGIMQNHLETFR